MSYLIPPHVRNVRDDEGVVLLNVQSGAYFTLNGVGARVWEQIEGGRTREEALDALGRRYPVSRDRLARDVDTLLTRLIDKGLLACGEAAAGGAGAGPADRVQATTRSSAARISRQRFAFPERLLWSLLGFAALVGIDVLLHVAGFARFHRAVSRWRARPRRALDPADAARISAAVDAASAFYFKRAWCLQRSAATTCLLRLCGFPAELVIGVQRLPFMAHAWVELDGRIVNDNPGYCGMHEIIERC